MDTTAGRRRVLLEVAVASVEDAVAAREGGADRLELCAALALGGLTPSLGMLHEVRRAVDLPLMAMARPRAGGFAYSGAEFRVLQRDADILLGHGAADIVFGVLEEDGRVDLRRCRAVVRQAGGRPVVFHRAFDLTPDPLVALDQLIDLGVRRVLTSGQRPSALAGADLIAALRGRATGRIEILPCAGVNASTASELLARTGCDQVHASLRTRRSDPSTSGRPTVSFGSAGGTEVYEATDPAAVAALRAALDRVA
jgi:copper homeostasis protein